MAMTPRRVVGDARRWKAMSHPLRREMLAHLDAMGLSKYDMPEYLLELDHIPLTPSGKMRKRDIVDWIAEGRVIPEPVRASAVRTARG